MVVIRLARVGKKKQPEYRIVVADKRRAATGRFIDIIGHYNPLTDPAQVTLDTEKFMEWLGKGAQPSDTVQRLYERTEKGEEILNKPKNRKKTETTAQAAPAAQADEVTDAEATPSEEPVPADSGDVEAPAEETADAPTETPKSDPTPEEPTDAEPTPDAGEGQGA